MKIIIKTESEVLYECDTVLIGEDNEAYEIESEKVKSILSKRTAVSYLINFKEGFNAFEASVLSDLKPDMVESQIIIVS